MMPEHYSDVIMSAMASQITSLMNVYSTVYSGGDTSKLSVTGLCEVNSPVTGEFPSQRACNDENVSIWWHHNEHPMCKWFLHILMDQKLRNFQGPFQYKISHYYDFMENFTKQMYWKHVLYIITCHSQAFRKTGGIYWIGYCFSYFGRKLTEHEFYTGCLQKQ